MQASLDFAVVEDSQDVRSAPSTQTPRAPADRAAGQVKVERVKKRRPLSPICPYTSEDEIPRRFDRLRHIVPWGISIALHTAVVVYGIVTFEVAMQHARLEHVVEGPVSLTVAEMPVPLSAAPVVENVNPMQALVKAVPVDIEAPPPRDPVNARQSMLDREEIVEAPPPVAKANLAKDPIVLGAAVEQVALATPKHVSHLANPTFASAAPVDAKPKETTAVPFFGVNGNARSVVYLCDASGSMIGTDETIASQLQHAVLALSPSQQFNVVFFSGGAAPITFSPRQLLKADPTNKVSACNFAKRFTCKGKTNALPAIRAALKFKPDILYLVTDGALEDADEKDMLAAIRAANRDRATKINVILISGAPKVDADDLKFLTSVASETGGTCHVVNPNAM